MSEENKEVVDNNNDINSTTEGSKNNENIPYSRFQEVNSAKKQAETLAEERLVKLNEIEAEQKAKRETRMKKNEEYTTLLAEKDAEIEKLSSTATKWNDYETNRRDVLVSKLPENKQKFVSNMSLSDLEEFVDLESAPKGTGMDSSRQGLVRQEGTTPMDYKEISAEDKKKNWGSILADYKQRSVDKGTLKK